MPELTRTPASVPELAALLAPRLPDILDLATRLTEVESGSFLPAGVDRVSDLVAERLAALGFTSRRHTIASGRGRAFEATLKPAARDFGSSCWTRRHGLARGSDGRLAHRDERAHHVRARSR
ncbi:hypothetical protein GS415_06205 [Rhodococcus hoagii]|nr:hypothetical protein [Prescottella equi]